MSFVIGMGVRQWYVMLSWMFNIFLKSCMKEMKASIEKVGAKMKLDGMDRVVMAHLIANNTLSIAENKGDLQSGG